MASPLSIAPSGIGSGEAQIIKMPLTEKALFTKYQNDLKRNQEEKLKEAEDIAKMNVEGTHRGDAKKLTEVYNGVIDAYAKYSTAKTRTERAAAKIAYEEAKADFNFKIANSKDYNKLLYDIGQAMLGAGAEDYTPEQKAYYNQLKNASSFDTQIDLEQFNKKAKPLDVIDINQKVIKASTIPKSTTFGQGNIAGKDVIITSSGEALSKPLFFDNLSAVIQQQPRYAQEVLIPKYKDIYIKQGGDIANTEKFTESIFNNEFESQRPAVDVTKKSASQVGQDWNNIYTFGGGQPQRYIDKESGEDVVSMIQIDKPTDNGSVSYKIPVKNSISWNIPFKANFNQGVYKITKDGGDIQKVIDDKQPEVRASGIIEVPVTIKDGKEVLSPAKGTSITEKSGRKYTQTFSRDKNANVVYKKFVQVTEAGNDSDESYLIPLENVPVDKLVKSDDPVLKAVASWGGSQPVKSSAPTKKKKENKYGI